MVTRRVDWEILARDGCTGVPHSYGEKKLLRPYSRTLNLGSYVGTRGQTVSYESGIPVQSVYLGCMVGGGSIFKTGVWESSR